MRRVAWLAVLAVALPLGEAALAPERDLSAEERLELERKALKLYAEGMKSYRAGRLDLAAQRWLDMLALQRRLYPPTRFPDGHKGLAVNLHNVGKALASLGRNEEALGHHEESLAIHRKLYPKERFPDGHELLANSLSGLGATLHHLGRLEGALACLEEALAMRRKLYPLERAPDGHPDIAHSLNNTGNVLRDLGRYESALAHYEEALAMRWRLYPEKRFPAGHHDLALSLHNTGVALRDLGRPDTARARSEEALAMYRRLYPEKAYPDGHKGLTSSLGNLGACLRDLGRHEDALALFEQALTMHRKLYAKERFPQGHHDLAVGLNDVGNALASLGRHEDALARSEEALAMQRKLYPPERFPDGHEALAVSLHNLGAASSLLGRDDAALARYEEALAMRRRLYPKERFPDGHEALAVSLNSAGVAQQERGRHEDALALFEQALAMRRRLYPDKHFPAGHNALARSLTNLGFALNDLGRHELALAHYEAALAMQRRLLLRLSTDATTIADASLPTRDLYLSALRRGRGLPSAYRGLAPGRAVLGQVQALRQASARAASSASPRVRDLLGRLATASREHSALLLARSPSPARQARAAQLAAEVEALRRQVAHALPLLDAARIERFDADELSRLLPAGSAFLDLVRFVDFPTHAEEQKGARSMPRYAAFAVAPGRRPAFLDLGDANPVDRAVASWREAIRTGVGQAKAADEVARRVWRPLREKLPARLTTLYVAPDGALALLPWAALSSGEGKVLLEECAVALVPHAYFLLDRLALAPSRPAPGAGSVLAVGDIFYRPAVVDRPPVRGEGHLPGTAREVELLRQLGGKDRPVHALDRARATVSRVSEGLVGKRYAHLATHGFFDERRFAEDERRRLRWRQGREAGEYRPGAGRDNPLAYVGLLLAGSEVPEHAGPGGGRLTGAAVIDFDLGAMELAVLSACQTGVGSAVRRGEGVLGLQHAFHLAGAHNVLSSLWEVEDEATAALMGLFYRNLWKEGMTPLEALRQAQLYLMRHPEALPLLARRRGDSFLVDDLPPVKPALPGARRASPYLWAGFALSGLGR